MEKVIIDEIDGFAYTLIDREGNHYNKDIELYDNLTLEVNDILYIDDGVLKSNLLAFGKVGMDDKAQEDDLIKVIRKDKTFYLERRYG